MNEITYLERSVFIKAPTYEDCLKEYHKILDSLNVEDNESWFKDRNDGIRREYDMDGNSIDKPICISIFQIRD